MKSTKAPDGSFRLAIVILAVLGAASLDCRSATAAAGAPSVATPASPGYTVMRIRIHYRSRRLLSRSLAQINLSLILAGADKPWMLAQLPKRLNEFYIPGKNETIPAKVVSVLTHSTENPLKSVIWSGPKDWRSSWGGNSEEQMVRQLYHHEQKGEYLRSFQGLVLFRVNEGVKGMHRIDPIWQVSEKWKTMVKLAWLFCKKHKAWFPGNGPVRHIADLKRC